MEVRSISMTVLKPSEGMVLTDGNIYSETEIYISCNDKEENYHEITYEEYIEILKKKEELRNKENLETEIN